MPKKAAHEVPTFVPMSREESQSSMELHSAVNERMDMIDDAFKRGKERNKKMGVWGARLEEAYDSWIQSARRTSRVNDELSEGGRSWKANLSAGTIDDIGCVAKASRKAYDGLQRAFVHVSEILAENAGLQSNLEKSLPPLDDEGAGVRPWAVTDNRSVEEIRELKSLEAMSAPELKRDMALGKDSKLRREMAKSLEEAPQKNTDRFAYTDLSESPEPKRRKAGPKKLRSGVGSIERRS